MHAVRVIITLVAVLSIQAMVRADEHESCSSLGVYGASRSDCECKACRPVVKEKKVDEWYWVCTEDEFCVPCPSLRPGDCGPRHAVVHTRKKLKRVKVECTECEIDWEVVSTGSCSACGQQPPRQHQGSASKRPAQSSDPPSPLQWFLGLVSQG
jgi:hypothetical protein